MTRVLGTRHFRESRMTGQRAETLQFAAESVSEQLPGDHHTEITEFDPTTSNRSLAWFPPTAA
jgi:hypothetical protein